MDDRRNSERFDVDLEAEIRSCDGEPLQVGVLKNISKGGAFFLTDEKLKLGDRVEIRLGSGLSFIGEVLRSSDLNGLGNGFAVKFLEKRVRAGDESRMDDTVAQRLVYQLELKSFNSNAFEYYPQLARVHDFVRENYTENVTLEQVARVAAMEKTYFSFFFRQKVRTTFSSWLQYVRIESALQMMERSDHTITDVAYSVGFNELSAFQKAFKKWTSLTPRIFKKLARPA
jgi:AraC-like DNA-binding protein